MARPAVTTTDALLARILAEQSRQGRKLAVIRKQFKAVPDHEVRLRKLEQFRFIVLGAALAASGVGTWIGTLSAHR